MQCFDEMTLMFFLDGELSKQKKHRVSGHLMTCQKCRDLIRCLREENKNISRLFTPDHRITDQTRLILDRIKSVDQHDVRKRKILLPARRWKLGVAAAGLFIFILLLFIFTGRDSNLYVSHEQVLVQAASIDGQPVETHVFGSGDEDIVFIWLEKM